MDFPVVVDNPIMSIICIVLITIAAKAITYAIGHLLHKMDKYKGDTTAITLIQDILDFVVYFVAIMIILQFFGIDLGGTLFSVGIIGIIASLAAKDLISNLISGIILITGKSIKEGDTIEIDNKKGFVKGVKLRTTTLYDDHGVELIVPNSTLTNHPFYHFLDPEIYRVDIFTELGLNIDAEKFREYIIEKIKSYHGIAETPEPDVSAKEMSFMYYTVKVSFWVKDFETKEEYRYIITNEIRKYMDMKLNDKYSNPRYNIDQMKKHE